MGIRDRRTLAICAVAAVVLGAGIVLTTCGGGRAEPPARVWVADPVPPPGVPVATIPDVRTEPGGASVEDWDPTWFWHGRTSEDMRTGIQLLHPMGVADWIRVVVRGTVIRSQAEAYDPTDEVVRLDGTDWRACDRSRWPGRR